MKAALIYDELSPAGARSWVEAEYESPETIEALLEAMRAHCCRVVPIPFGPSLIDKLQREEPGLALNIAEGRRGASRESIVPDLLDLLEIPYTGSDGVALGVSLNKALTKHVARDAGIRTPDWRLLHSAEQAERAAAELEFPVLVKPNFGGSSIGVGPDSVVHRPAALVELARRQVAAYGQPCLAERYINGVDATVGLLGNGSPEAFPAGVVVTAEGIYSATVKQKHDREIICPCELPEEIQGQIMEWAATVHRLIGARDFSRVDFMVDETGRAHFLEINPLPGLSPYYGVYPVLAEAAGYSYTGIIGAIIERALTRTEQTRSALHEGLAR